MTHSKGDVDEVPFLTDLIDEEWFAKQNVHSIELQVLSGNQPAIGFWEKLGYASELLQCRKVLLIHIRKLFLSLSGLGQAVSGSPPPDQRGCIGKADPAGDRHNMRAVPNSAAF